MKSFNINQSVCNYLRIQSAANFQAGDLVQYKSFEFESW